MTPDILFWMQHHQADLGQTWLPDEGQGRKIHPSVRNATREISFTMQLMTFWRTQVTEQQNCAVFKSK